MVPAASARSPRLYIWHSFAVIYGAPSLAASGKAAMGKALAPARLEKLEPASMPIRRLAISAAYSPEQITMLISAHEGACAALGISFAQSARAEAVALKVLECAAKGEFDPDRLRDYAIHALRCVDE
jgi:hypothetical protein